MVQYEKSGKTHWSNLGSIYGPSLLEEYGREPFVLLESKLDDGLWLIELILEQEDILAAKVENSCRKLYMMNIAGKKTIEQEFEFIATQSRECPALLWDNEVDILYHLESMVLFSRSALDIASYIFAFFLLEPLGKARVDSLNKFTKAIMTDKNPHLVDMKAKLGRLMKAKTSWLRILCGSEKGRSFRDKIAHQTIARIEYREAYPTSQRRYCHVMIDGHAIPLEEFISDLTKGVIGFFYDMEDLIIEILQEVENKELAKQNGSN